MEPSTGTALPGIDDMIKTARPETCESSATGIPPPSIQNRETINGVLETPPTALLSSLPAVCHATLMKNAFSKAATSKLPVDDHLRTISRNESVFQTQSEQPVKKTQRKKRRAPQQERKLKQPRSGPQVNPKKRGKRKSQKKIIPSTSTQSDCIKDGENAQLAGEAGDGVEKKTSTRKETAADELVENTEYKNTDEISGSKDSAEKVKLGAVPSRERANVRQLEPAADSDEVTRFREDADKEEVRKCTEIRDSEAAKSSSNHNNRETLDDTKNGITTTEEKGNEQSLEEKYEDLARRYTHLIRGILQEKPRSGESSDREREDGVGKLVDCKLYDAIYLCKIGGMLGALKVDGGSANLMRGRVAGIDNAYIQIMKDGFEFVEGLMTMGEEPEKNLTIVRRVFRDLHVGLLMDIWERFHVVDGGVLVGTVVKVLAEQMKKWYMMIIKEKMSIRWTRFITEDFVVIVVRRLSDKAEKLAKEVVNALYEVLKEISRYYQKCENGSGSYEMFYNSCEVSVCIADGVPEAALSLREEDAFVIGRHNGVFARCVARLLAERETEEAS